MSRSTVASVAKRPRALVAEDDSDMRRYIAALMRSAGYDVVQASDGVDLLSEIEATFWDDDRQPFEVIVSDINMPGLTGLDALAALPHALWNTPVILITAYGDAATCEEAHALGAFAVLAKPFVKDDLRALLKVLPR